MLQGFYMLAMQRARRQRRIALTACTAAVFCALFAEKSYFSPEVVAVSAVEPPLLAQSEAGRLVVTRGGEVVLRTAIDVRSLPAADRAALDEGIALADEQALARLLEDYGS